MFEIWKIKYKKVGFLLNNKFVYEIDMVRGNRALSLSTRRCYQSRYFLGGSTQMKIYSLKLICYFVDC